MAVKKKNKATGSELPYVCVRTTDTYFLVATSEPFEKGSEGYSLFDEFSCTDPRTLEEGSQVFIYERAAWGTDGEEDLMEYIRDIGKQVGGIMLESVVMPSALTMRPLALDPVKS